MASKRRIRRKECGSKIRYATVELANAFIHSLFRLGKKQGWLSAYKCKHCNGYHVGHPNKAARQSATDKAKNRA